MSSTTELAAWLNGTPTGGPNSDGRYPLTYADDLVYLVYCPEAQALNPALAEEPIEVFANTATNAAATATAESAEATQASTDAQTYAANALASKNAAAASATAASGSATTASTGATTATTQAGIATTQAGYAAISAADAATSETNAAASAATAAAAAGTFPVGGTIGQFLWKTGSGDYVTGWRTLVKGDVGLGSVDNTTDADKPISTATQTALDMKAPLASPTFTGTVGGITAAMVGLGSVNNTTDALKPISTATQAALDLKAPTASPTFTGTVGGITAAMVGLGSVNNTTDAGKPISTATQTALDLKAPLNAPSFTTSVDLKNGAGLWFDGPTLTRRAYAYMQSDTSWRLYSAVLDSLAISIDITTGAVNTAGALTQGGSQVWHAGNLTPGNYSLTSHAHTFAQITSLPTTLVGYGITDAAPLASPTFTGTVGGITAAMVGLGSVDNTTDAAKPISTATQTALNLKANLASPTFTGTPSLPTGATGVTQAAGDSSTKFATTAFVRTVSTQSVTSAATVTPTFANDFVKITAQAAALTLANPSGTAQDGWGIVIRIKDNGTARAISYGTQYRAVGVTLPTTTVINKTLYIGMVYNSANTKWDVVSVAQEA